MDENSNSPVPENETSNEHETGQENATVNQETQSNDAIQVTQEEQKLKTSVVNKKVLLIIGAVLVLLLGATVGLILWNSSGETTPTSNSDSSTEPVTTLGATIANIEGSVQYSKDGELWQDASGGESLAHLDYVRTLDGSRAILLFDDGSVTRLDANSQVYLSSLQTDAFEITLEDGQIYNRVVASENHSYTVVTANERFQALGTAYTTSTDGSKDEVKVYESDVKVVSQELDVKEGNKYDTETKEATSLDLDSLKTDEFTQWNKQKDTEIEAFKDKLGVLADKEEETAPPPTPTNSGTPAGISLSGEKIDKGVRLNWTVSGLAAKQGFKIVRDKKDSTPTYGENQAQYVGDASARSTVWYDDNGGTYYYRICIYNEGSCSNYSNVVQLESPLVAKEPVQSGSINLAISGKNLSWTLTGGTAPHGFKILLSQEPNPTYPSHSIKYVGAETSAVTLPEKGAGTYYVRICKYTNGTQEQGCVDYSNQVEYGVN